MGMPGVAFPLLFLAGDGVYSSSSLSGSKKNLALLRFLGVAGFFFVADACERSCFFSFAASSFAALAAAAFSALAFLASAAFFAFSAFSRSRVSRAAEAA